MSAGDPKDVTVWVDGRPVQCKPARPLLNELLNQGIVVETACMGQGTCFLCRVTVTEGGDHLGPPTAPEKRGLGNVLLEMGMRLSCQIEPEQTLKIERPLRETPAERRERIKRARARKKGEG